MKFLVDYPDLSSLNNDSGITGLLALPNASYPWFWTLIIVGIWAIITFTLYFSEKSIKGRGNMLSCASISSLSCIILSLLGSLLGILTVVTQVPIIVFCVIIIVIWIFSN